MLDEEKIAKLTLDEFIDINQINDEQSLVEYISGILNMDPEILKKLVKDYGWVRNKNYKMILDSIEVQPEAIAVRHYKSIGVIDSLFNLDLISRMYEKTCKKSPLVSKQFIAITGSVIFNELFINGIPCNLHLSPDLTAEITGLAKKFYISVFSKDHSLQMCYNHDDTFYDKDHSCTVNSSFMNVIKQHLINK